MPGKVDGEESGHETTGGARCTGPLPSSRGAADSRLCSCLSPGSDGSRDRHLSFSDLQSDPDLFKKTWAMLGGKIIAVRNAVDITSIEGFTEAP